MKTISFLLLAICLTGCFSTITDDELRRLDPLLKPYLDKFIEEADSRGVKLETYNLKMGFGHLESAVGMTYYGGPKSATVVIDSATRSWKVEPESLVFHELGHALLRRDHLNTKFPKTDIYTSIMTSGRVHYEDLKNNIYQREYYINELFNPSESTPNWIN